MGLLLVVVMLINMVLALILVPLLVYLFRPKFLDADISVLSESVAPAQPARAPPHAPHPLVAR